MVESVVYLLQTGDRRDFRRVSDKDVDFMPSELRNQLLPVLRADMVSSPKDFKIWVEKMVNEYRHRLEIVLPYKDNGLNFTTVYLTEEKSFQNF